MQHSRFITTLPVTPNTAIGHTALAKNTTGSQSTALGQGAGFNQTTGSGNVYIGVVPGVLVRVTPATSKAFSDKRLPTEFQSSLTQTISSEQ
jgi:hypothetical protein